MMNTLLQLWPGNLTNQLKNLRNAIEANWKEAAGLSGSKNLVLENKWLVWLSCFLAACSVPAKLAETASTDMLGAMRVVLADMAMPSAAAALPWLILSVRLDREEVVWLLKRIVG